MTTCDPNELMESAKCFRCIPKRALKEVMIYLLCQWAGGLPANNPPQVSDFTFAIVGNDSIITVSENPPIGIPGFEGQFRVNGIGFWSESFSVAPGTVTQPFLPVSGFTYEAQIRWATGLGVGVSAWSPSIYFTV